MHQSQRLQLAQDLTSGRVKIQDLSEAEQIAAFGSVFYRSDLLKGEAEGHPFRGNQYTEGSSVRINADQHPLHGRTGKVKRVIPDAGIGGYTPKGKLKTGYEVSVPGIDGDTDIFGEGELEADEVSQHKTAREQRQELFQVEDQDETLVRLKDKQTGEEGVVSVREARRRIFEVEPQDEESPFEFEFVGASNEDSSSSQALFDQQNVGGRDSHNSNTPYNTSGKGNAFLPDGSKNPEYGKPLTAQEQALGMTEAEFNHLDEQGMMNPWGPSKEGQAELKRLREGKTRGYSAAGQKRQDRRAKIESQNPGKTVEQVLGAKMEAQQNHIANTTVELANSEMTQMALEHLQDNNFKVTRRGSKLYFDNPKDQNAAIESLRGLGIKSGLDSQRASISDSASDKKFHRENKFYGISSKDKSSVEASRKEFSEKAPEYDFSIYEWPTDYGTEYMLYRSKKPRGSSVPKAQRMDTAEEIRAATAADRRAQRGPNWKTKLKADAERASRR